MKTIERTAKKIVIEITKAEMKQKGFDAIWDEIRENFSANLYEIDSVENFEKLLLLKLKLKKF